SGEAPPKRPGEGHRGAEPARARARRACLLCQAARRSVPRPRGAPRERSPSGQRSDLLRCVYTDLDGTLLGKGASLFRDAEGAFTLLPARALEACFRAGAEVVLKSGRRKAQVMEDARLIGQTSFIYEMGCGLVIDGEETLLMDGDLKPRDGRTTHQLIEDAGAPTLLFDTYAGRLEHHSPWHR